MRAEHNGHSIRTYLLIFLAVAAAFGLLFLAFEWVGGLLQDEQPEESSPAEQEQDGPVRKPAPNPYDLSLFREEDGFIVYDGEPEARRGIDVSAHQGAIDWEAVAASGVEYAMIRVGYRGYTKGETTLDALFYENVAGARANGIDVGVYFFSQAITREEAVEEAEIVLRAIEGLEITYPVVFDWENIEQEARTDAVDPAALTGIVRAFCRTIKAAGYTPGVYFNQVFGYQIYNLLALDEYVLWLAQYAGEPDFRYRFEMWQYACDGKVNGITGNVDLNLSFWQKPDS